MGDVKHYQNSAEAIKKIREIAESTNIGMLCTNLTEMPISTCPMATQKVEDDGEIWFLSGKDSSHNRDIKKDERVQLIYANPGSSSFLSLYGTAEVSHDRQKIDEMWTNLAKVWFPEGKEDPNLSLICVKPEEGYYWDTKTNKMIAFLQMAVSVVTGKMADGGIEGKLKP